jgi:predicted aminopeptidase
MNAPRRPSLRATLVVAAFLMAGLSSCQTVKFYKQALDGQMEMLQAARPIPEVKREAATKPALREKLTLVEEMRAFAKTALKLPVKEQFATYADLHREFAVWVVYAAPEFSVESKTWWYPLVGTLKYRGFFRKEEAQAEVNRLKKQGYEVFGAGVPAYSTLGWFSDPVLNTFIQREEPELAELIFHELSHPRVFFPGDTDFNEAFATASAHDAVSRWLKAHGKVAAMQDYEKGLKENTMVLKLILGTRERLKELYAQKALTPDEMRLQKAGLIEKLRQEYKALRTSRHTGKTYDAWFAHPINNARLCALASYFDLVPGFQTLLKKCGGDRQKFYAECEKLKRLSPEERRTRLGL